MPYLIFSVKSPCCPSKISFKNEKIANQTMGVMSTPKAGGITPRMDRSSNSVGHTTRLKGNSFSFTEGYQEITTRQSYMNKRFHFWIVYSEWSSHQELWAKVNMSDIRTMANDMRFKIGPRIKERGWTHGSVSAKISCEDWVTRLDQLLTSEGSDTNISIWVFDLIWWYEIWGYDCMLWALRIMTVGVENASILTVYETMESKRKITSQK